MEPETALILGGAPLVYKVLGPTADYIGQELRGGTEKSVNNVKRILAKAAHKLGERTEQPGAVPPRVAKYLLQEGRFCDDELTSEYFGGVLASSKSEVPRDDRGVALLSLVSRLTTYQIRSHYMFYYIIKELFDGEALRPTLGDDRLKMRTYIPLAGYTASMDFSKAEDARVITHHVMFGLVKEDLVGDDFWSGTVDHLRKAWQEADQPGMLFYPSGLGIELFLWAHGQGSLPTAEFLKPDVRFELVANISIHPGYRRAA